MHTRRHILVAVCTAIVLLGGTTSQWWGETRSDAHGPHMPPNAASSPDGFDASMAAAMTRMDAGMGVAPSGDPDRDFAAMMIPHHQGAVDMALLELEYGNDPVLKRLAQEIIITQRQEIDVMRRALDARTAAKASRR
jgi:uncharacterized protein (DUF305 family)